MEHTLENILKQFNIEVSIESYGNGHINDTYIAECNPRYILQRINQKVFRNPAQVMDNIQAVTRHLRKKIIAAGGDPDRETLNLIQTVDGKPYYQASETDYYRVYKFVENAVSYDRVENPEQFYQAAKAFGRFQNMLSDFPSERLHETIVKFHDTRDRYEQLKRAAAEDPMGRAASVQKELEFAFAREKDTDIINENMKSGAVPLRVTHNDTKLNNVLLDQNTGEGVCVIDLDTVMPGSMLFDYGDALRFGANHAAEDEKDLSQVYLDMELYESFTKGFLEEMTDVTETEAELLPFSAKMMTYECGIRFLTDYLLGDTYFKCHYKGHNLDRARTQLKLVADMEEKLPEMKKIVAKYIQK